MCNAKVGGNRPGPRLRCTNWLNFSSKRIHTLCYGLEGTLKVTARVFRSTHESCWKLLTSYKDAGRGANANKRAHPVIRIAVTQRSALPTLEISATAKNDVLCSGKPCPTQSIRSTIELQGIAAQHCFQVQVLQSSKELEANRLSGRGLQAGCWKGFQHGRIAQRTPMLQKSLRWRERGRLAVV